MLNKKLGSFFLGVPDMGHPAVKGITSQDSITRRSVELEFVRSSIVVESTEADSSLVGALFKSVALRAALESSSSKVRVGDGDLSDSISRTGKVKGQGVIKQKQVGSLDLVDSVVGLNTISSSISSE